MTEVEATAPFPASRTRLWVATSIAVALGIIYLVFAGLYIATRVVPAPDAVLQAAVSTNAVSVVFVPQRVDPERESAQGVLRVVVDRATLTSDIDVSVYPFLDASRIQVPASESAFERHALLSLEGEVRTYPFDSYTGTVLFSATDSATGAALPVSGGVLPIDGLTGWSISVTDATSADTVTDSVIMSRSYTTQVTAVILATLALVLGAIAVALAWAVAVGRKQSNFGEATWLAATIFSVISVRNFMPGAPPIGAYLDALAIIPAILTLFLSMALLVVFWLVRKTDEAGL